MVVTDVLHKQWIYVKIEQIEVSCKICFEPNLSPSILVSLGIFLAYLVCKCGVSCCAHR